MDSPVKRVCKAIVPWKEGDKLVLPYVLLHCYKVDSHTPPPHNAVELYNLTGLSFFFGVTPFTHTYSLDGKYIVMKVFSALDAYQSDRGENDGQVPSGVFGLATVLKSTCVSKVDLAGDGLITQ